MASTAAAAASPRPSKLTLLREKSFAPTVTVNPFVHSDSNFSKYNRAKLVLLFPLALVRILLCVLICLVCAMWCRLLLLGYPEPREDCADPDMSHARRWLINVCVRAHCRAFLFCMGFYWIPVKGQQHAQSPRPRLMIANHTTMVDVVVLLYVCAPSFLSKSSVLKAPLVGSVCRAMQVIGVDRFNPGDKSRTRTKMANYLARGKARPPLLVFPEGTTSRYDTVMRFKPGAFDFTREVDGGAIQPILLHWRFRHFDPSSTATTDLKSWLMYMMTQFVHHVEVEYLPVLRPQDDGEGGGQDDEEGAPGANSDALVFAHQAQRAVLHALNQRASQQPTTGCCWSNTGFPHTVHSVSCNVDDFLVWKWFLRASIPDIKYTLLTYSLESIRDVLGLVTPLLRGKVDLTMVLQCAERYARVWHSTKHQDQQHAMMNKSLLCYTDVTTSLLRAEASPACRQIFISAFAEACLFQTNLPAAAVEEAADGETSSFNEEKFDFRQFATALLWVSPTHLVWGSGKYAVLDEPYVSDAGVHKWISVRARLAFAYVCSHQPLREDVSRADVAAQWKQDGLAVWDAAMGVLLLPAASRHPLQAEEEEDEEEEEENRAAAAAVAAAAASNATAKRFTATEFCDEIINGVLQSSPSLPSSPTHHGDADKAELAARRGRQVGCLDLLNYFFARMDEDFCRTYYAGGSSFFLSDADTAHRRVSEHDVEGGGGSGEEEEDKSKHDPSHNHSSGGGGASLLITKEEQV